MIGYNCVMIRLTNPQLKQLHDKVISDLGDHIYADALSDYAPGCLVDPDPHITLIYDLEPLSFAYISKYLKVDCRKLLYELRQNPNLLYHNLKCNTFENDDFIVLKIDFSEVPGIDNFRSLSKKLCELPNQWKFSDPYQPHLTLTYLKKDTPKDKIDAICKWASTMNTMFMIDSILVSSSDGDQQVIKL